MDIPLSDYQTNYKDYQFPADETNPAKKTKEWAKKIGEALISGWLNNSMAISQNKRRDFATWRLYAADRQPTDQYKEKLTILDPDGTRKHWMNISWDNLAIASSILSKFVGIFNLLEHNIIATSIDSAGGGLKEDIEYQIRAEMELKDTLAMLNMASPATNEEIPVIPKSIEEFRMFKKLGVFRLLEEIAAEMILQHTYNISNWSELKKMLTKDVFSLGWFAYRRYLDYTDYKVKAKYIDPDLLIVPYSQFPDHHDISQAGYIEYYTINQLRPSLIRDGYTEEQIFEIAKKYQGYMGNPSYSFEFQDCNQFHVSHGFMPYENHKIAVLHYEFQSTDNQRWKSHTDQYGRKKTEKKAADYKLAEGSKAEIKDIPIIQLYNASWIIGSDCVYEFGPSPDLPRKSSNADKHKDIPLSSFFVYKTDDNPLLNRMVPHINKMNLADKKFQNALAKAKVKGMVILQDALQNVDFGGGNLKPIQTLKIYQDDGTLLIAKSDDWGKQMGGGMPVVEVEGGIGKALDEFYTIMKAELGFIREAIGMPSIADMAINNPDLLKGVAQMVSAESNNALHYIYSAYKNTKEKFSESVIAQIQVLALQNKMQGYQQVLGKSKIEAIKIRGYFPLAEMGIRLELKPNDDEKKVLMVGAEKAQVTPLIQGGITFAEFAEVFRYVQSGNIKMAQVYLSYKQQENMDNALKIQRENIELQGKATAEGEAKKSEARMAEEQLKTNEKIRAANELDEVQKRVDERKHLYKMEEIGEMGRVAILRTADTNQTAKDIQDKKTTENMTKHLTMPEKKQS